MWIVVHDIYDNTVYINTQKICAIYHNKCYSVIECDTGVQYFIKESVEDIIRTMQEKEEGIKKPW